jgi:hypothetical protein
LIKAHRQRPAKAPTKQNARISDAFYFRVTKLAVSFLMFWHSVILVTSPLPLPILNQSAR